MAFTFGPDSPGVGIRFFPAFQSATLPPIQDDQENDWFAGAMQCFAPLALAATVAANATAGQIAQQAATWDQGDNANPPAMESVGVLLVVPQIAPPLVLRFPGGTPDDLPLLQAEEEHALPPFVTWPQPWPMVAFGDDGSMPSVVPGEDAGPPALVLRNDPQIRLLGHDGGPLSAPPFLVEEDQWQAPAPWPNVVNALPPWSNDDGNTPPIVMDEDAGPPALILGSDIRVQFLGHDGGPLTAPIFQVDDDQWLPPSPWPTPWPLGALWDADAVPIVPVLGTDEDLRSPFVSRSDFQIILLSGDGCYTSNTAQLGVDDEPLVQPVLPPPEPTVLFGPWSFAVAEDGGYLPEEDYWFPTALYSNPTTVPAPWIWDAQEITVTAVANEDHWQPRVLPPTPFVVPAPWADDGVWLPAPVVDDDYWQNWVAPQPLKMVVPLPAQFGQDEMFPGPAVRALDDGLNWIAPETPFRLPVFRYPNASLFETRDNRLIVPIGWIPLDAVSTVSWGAGSIGTQNPWLPLSAVSSINSNDTWGVDYRLAATEVRPAAISNATWRTPRTFSSQYTSPP